VHDDVDAQVRAAMARADSGDIHGALERLRSCVTQSPGHFVALGSLGSIEQRLGHFQEAEKAFREALTLRPSHASTLQCLANVLVLQDQFHHAAPIYERILQQGDAPFTCKTALCRCYLQQGRWSEAASLCDALLVHVPRHAGLISMRDIARRERGDINTDARHVRALISTCFPEPPTGYESIAAFHHVLADQVQARHDLVENPHDKTTREGFQTGNLLPSDEACFDALGSMIRTRVEVFLRECAVKGRGSYWESSATDMRLSLWGTILKAGGHQEPHIHQTAWLSGVYYARLPEKIHCNDPSRSGWIEFGQPPARYPCKAEYPLECLCPREGMLVMFPSHLFHRTIPLRGDKARISFAFDLIVC
jgi:uncharacterized protein (TIGR02466 family)